MYIAPYVSETFKKLYKVRKELSPYSWLHSDFFLSIFFQSSFFFADIKFQFKINFEL